MTIDSGRGRPGTPWSHKLVSGRIPAMKRRLPEDDLRDAHPPPSTLNQQGLTCITLSIIFWNIKSVDNPRSQGDQVVLRSRHGGYLQQSTLEGRTAYLSRADPGRSSEKTRPAKRRRQPGFASNPAGESIGTTKRRPERATQHTNQQPVPGMFRLER